MVNILMCYKSILQKIVTLAGMQSKHIEVEPGTVLHFWVPSKPIQNKPPLLLLHCFGSDGLLTWQFQILSSLRKQYSIYVPDLLFFGVSYTASRHRTTRFQADCMAKGLRKLGVQRKCRVVGFSYGGFVAFQMAEHHPELVEALVITGSWLALAESVSRKALERNGFGSWPEFMMPTSVEGVKVMLDISCFKFPWFPHLFYKHYLQVRSINRKERIELLDALLVRDDAVTNHQFQQTIHLIWGKEEKIFNMEAAITLKEKLGGKCKLEVISRAGHLAPLERPFAFNKRLKEVLSSLEQHISC